MEGGAGTDSVSYANITGSVGVDLISNNTSGAAGSDVLSGFERAVGTSSSDTLTGGPGTVILYGGDGEDIIDVADGASGDTADGGSATDACSGDVGDSLTNCE